MPACTAQVVFRSAPALTEIKQRKSSLQRHQRREQAGNTTVTVSKWVNQNEFHVTSASA